MMMMIIMKKKSGNDEELEKYPRNTLNVSNMRSVDPFCLQNFHVTSLVFDQAAGYSNRPSPTFYYAWLTKTVPASSAPLYKAVKYAFLE